MQILGIDIGGTGIKGAPVDVENGALMGERYRLRTPRPSAPEAVAEAVAEVVGHFQWQGAVGCTFPAPIRGGVAQTAANVDKAWIGFDGERLFRERTGLPVRLINDADAAGLAEMQFGAGKGERGVVFILTFGTGIGSAIFVNGCLMPNTELGHLEMRGRDAERWASDRARKKKGLTWEEWGEQVNEYLARLELLFSPDLFIIGGGVSKKADRFLSLLHTHARIVPAHLLNDAGIVGAALAAQDLA
ncbi:MAG: polyphosphate--glucose phosphotransferase [Anaerolineae bacterium]